MSIRYLESPNKESRVSDVGDFEDFYRAHYRRVVTVTAAIVGSRAEAEDIAQEAFSRALGRWSRLRDDYDAPDAWVRFVAVRLAIDSQRRRWRAGRLLQRLASFHARDEIVPESLAWTPVGAALMRVPVRQREALVLRYVADLPVETIARDHKIPLGTVKDRLSAGRRRLEVELQKEEARDGR